MKMGEWPFKRQPHKMVKHPKTILRLLRSPFWRLSPRILFLYIFYHFETHNGSNYSSNIWQQRNAWNLKKPTQTSFTCSKSTIETPELCVKSAQWRCFGVLVVNLSKLIYHSGTANPTKLVVFDHFVRLALKGLTLNK